MPSLTHESRLPAHEAPYVGQEELLGVRLLLVGEAQLGEEPQQVGPPGARRVLDRLEHLRRLYHSFYLFFNSIYFDYFYYWLIITFSIAYIVNLLLFESNKYILIDVQKVEARASFFQIIRDAIPKRPKSKATYVQISRFAYIKNVHIVSPYPRESPLAPPPAPCPRAD